MNVIKLASPRFNVIQMNRLDFFSFSVLLRTHFMKKKVDIQKVAFSWLKIFWLAFTKTDTNDIGFKYVLDEEAPFRYFSISKRGRLPDFKNIELASAYEGPLTLESKKYKDLLDLLPFIDPIFHNFFRNFKSSENVTNDVSDSDENYGDGED